LALLAVIIIRNPGIVNLSPAWLAFGDGSHNSKLVYIAPGPHSDAHPDTVKLLFTNHKTHPTSPPKAQPKTAPEPPKFSADVEPGDHDSHAGSPLGTMIDGPLEGHEVHVAYPTVYPNPPVDRDSLPRDLVGDVVIEVTIDSQGNVVETKIVQSIGHGIDEKIESTLRHWHYQPATLDGTPVASRHDVHFHFPS
jgi:TonB family protein